jgi:hypothetical protein
MLSVPRPVCSSQVPFIWPISTKTWICRQILGNVYCNTLLETCTEILEWFYATYKRKERVGESKKDTSDNFRKERAKNL